MDQDATVVDNCRAELGIVYYCEGEGEKRGKRGGYAESESGRRGVIGRENRARRQKRRD